MSDGLPRHTFITREAHESHGEAFEAAKRMYFGDKAPTGELGNITHQLRKKPGTLIDISGAFDHAVEKAEMQSRDHFVKDIADWAREREQGIKDRIINSILFDFPADVITNLRLLADSQAPMRARNKASFSLSKDAILSIPALRAGKGLKVPDKIPFKLTNGSQVRGSSGIDGKFINTIDEPFDPLLSGKAELRQGLDGRWKLYEAGEARTAKGTYDFIVQDGKVYVGTMRQRGQGHIEIAQGMPVDYAGQITFGQGKNTKGLLSEFNNASGHYIPQPIQPSWADSIPLPLDLFKPVKHSPY